MALWELTYRIAGELMDVEQVLERRLESGGPRARNATLQGVRRLPEAVHFHLLSLKCAKLLSDRLALPVP